MNVPHQITVDGGYVTGARALIEIRLHVETTCRPLGNGLWMILFEAPEDVDVDFLRPDVLPPR